MLSTCRKNEVLGLGRPVLLFQSPDWAGCSWPAPETTARTQRDPGHRSCGTSGRRPRGRQGKQTRRNEGFLSGGPSTIEGRPRHVPRAAARRRLTARPALPAARGAPSERASQDGWRPAARWVGRGRTARCSEAARAPVGRRGAARTRTPAPGAVGKARRRAGAGAEGAGRARPARSGRRRPAWELLRVRPQSPRRPSPGAFQD